MVQTLPPPPSRMRVPRPPMRLRGTAPSAPQPQPCSSPPPIHRGALASRASAPGAAPSGSTCTPPPGCACSSPSWGWGGRALLRWVGWGDQTYVPQCGGGRHPVPFELAFPVMPRRDSRPGRRRTSAGGDAAFALENRPTSRGRLLAKTSYKSPSNFSPRNEILEEAKNCRRSKWNGVMWCGVVIGSLVSETRQVG